MPTKVVSTVTTTRGVRGCPAPVPVNERASEVLAAFLSDEQLAEWEAKRRFTVVGGISKREFVIAHRGSEFARRNQYVIYDCARRSPLCWHDWTVPAEEEALGAKLLLELDESWIRPFAGREGRRFGSARFMGVRRRRNPALRRQGVIATADPNGPIEVF